MKIFKDLVQPKMKINKLVNIHSVFYADGKSTFNNHISRIERFFLSLLVYCLNFQVLITVFLLKK